MRNLSLVLFFVMLDLISSQNNITFSNPTRNKQNISNVWKNSKDNKGNMASSFAGTWSLCRNGHKSRRRHCGHHHDCDQAFYIQVARCQDRVAPSQWRGEFRNRENRPILKSKKDFRRQMSYGDKKLRGFSPWSSWSICSRQCMTVRKRYCMIPTICGHRIIKQSAYCYYEGSYCHVWIQNKIKRKNQEYNIEEDNSSPATPSIAIHKEDSYQSPPVYSCGKLGQYRGSKSARLRAHLHDMLRIIGGRPAPPGKWPWQVVVLNRYKEAFCGGTLVSLRWVVTAAHCVRKKLYIRLGEHDLFVRNYGEVEMKVTEAVIHPDYDPETVFNDVAMLRLPVPARPALGHGIACLPEPAQALAPHTSCTILGWGKRRASDVHGTRLLHEAQVSTIEQAVCRRSYWQYAINDNMVCAGRGRRDSCAGDSGGPLLCKHNMRYYLQGITSFGDGCGKRGKYGIYTRTSAYVTWMRGVMDKTYFDD